MSSLKSDQQLIIDKSGRFRIGGKFASKRQASAWKGARRRRGLSTNPQIQNLPDSPAAKRRRSEQSKRAASTRSLERLGVRPRDATTFINVNGVGFFSLPLDVVNAETIRASLDWVIERRPEVELVYAIIQFVDDEDDDFFGSVGKGFFRSVRSTNIVNLLIEDFTRVFVKYEVDRILQHFLRFTFQPPKP